MLSTLFHIPARVGIGGATLPLFGWGLLLAAWAVLGAGAVAWTVRRQGWATAVDAVQIGLNALAAPVFDHRGAWRGSLAVVGSSEAIPETPADGMIAILTQAAAHASRQLGWRGA